MNKVLLQVSCADLAGYQDIQTIYRLGLVSENVVVEEVVNRLIGRVKRRCVPRRLNVHGTDLREIHQSRFVQRVFAVVLR